jgi:putative ABC transport system permease protein
VRFFHQFRSRPLQSVLITLAVALGVAVITAVAAFLDIGSASSLEFEKSVEGRKITITAKANDWGAFYEGGVANPVIKLGSVEAASVKLTVDDVEEARVAAPSADYVYAEVAQYMGSNIGALAFIDAVGVTPDYMEVNDIKLSVGNSFISDDYEQHKMIALVSERLVKEAGLVGDPLGQKIEGYEIVGVLEANPDPNSFQPNMLIPFPSSPFNPLESLTFVVKDAAKVEEVRGQLETYARRTWGEGVTVRAPNDGSFSTQARAAAFIVAVLASVGLVIAGLNIMNLMTARVLEQSKAIGVLRSVGASRSDIRNRYLLDSLTLGVVGGLLGVALGSLLVFIFNRYLQTTNTELAQTLQVQLSLQALLIGFVMACLLSILFALYPAIIASRTNIINSLKEL